MASIKIREKADLSLHIKLGQNSFFLKKHKDQQIILITFDMHMYSTSLFICMILLCH